MLEHYTQSADSSKNTTATVNIIGGGLAGTEAAYQLAARGFKVRLFEMRPQYKTPAHKTGNLAELVCSNTFKSLAPHSAPGILKKELASLGSLLLRAADKSKVPAGEALAVDRELFSKSIEESLISTNNVERISMQVDSIDQLPEADATIIATGPLTQGNLIQLVTSLSDGHGLYFYDAIAPIVDAHSIDYSKVFLASRYGKSGEDYLNCPFTKEEYEIFYNALMEAEKVDFHNFEEPKYFQGCQPIESIAATGVDSLRFGAMKPVGLEDPKTKKLPYAVVQLRIDNISRSAYNIVGFQTKLKYPEQQRVFKLIPGLENAEFLRLGSLHRNTYICSPSLLNQNFSLKTNKRIHFAGQITGVEGYTESSAVGLLVAMSLWREFNNKEWHLPPRASALGSLCHYLFHSNPGDFQPINIHFGLFDRTLFNIKNKKISKKDLRLLMGEQCVLNLQEWKNKLEWTLY